jgi:hypothetical protein
MDGLLQAASSKKTMNMFERLPRIYDEFGELQERVEEETRKREELEAQLVAFTQDNVCSPPFFPHRAL